MTVTMWSAIREHYDTIPSSGRYVCPEIDKARKTSDREVALWIAEPVSRRREQEEA